MSRFLVLALAFLLMSSASIGHAATIFSNGPVNLQLDMEASGSDLQLADDFTLTAGNTTIRDVHWWGSTALVPGDFTIKIYEDANGLPGALPIFDVAPTALSIVDTNVNNVLGFDVYYYSAVVEPIELSAETTYWLSVFHSGVWLWSHDDAGTAAARFLPGDWSSPPLRLAFELTDDGQIPVPATLALLGIGLACLSIARRRTAQ